MPVNYRGMSKSEAKRKLEEAARKLDKVYMTYRGMSGVWDAGVVSMAQKIRAHAKKIK